LPALVVFTSVVVFPVVEFLSGTEFLSVIR
jgi:hypothetical protein